MAKMFDNLLKQIDLELHAQADESYRELVRTRYNMNVDRFMGVRTPEIHRIAGKYYQDLKTQPIEQRLDPSERLLATLVYEHKIMAFRWAHLARRDFAPEHLDTFFRWLETYVDDWIDCDDLCIHVIGEYFIKYTEHAKEVMDWTASPNMWVRRGAAVSLVLPARKGHLLPLVFQVSDRLIADHEDLVQKAYGWLLKVASKPHPQAVFDYVIANKAAMPRVAFRYALEKLPKELRQQALNV